MDDPFILTRDALKILAVDTRLDILKLLDDRPHTLTEIKDKLSLAPATVSEHLARLEEAGLIEKRDEGRKWKYYTLTKEGSKLFTKRPAGLTVAFAFSSLLAGALGFASLMTRSPAPADDAVPMMARVESAADTALAVEPSTALALPEWLLIGAIASGLIALVLLVVLLAKRLKKNV